MYNSIFYIIDVEEKATSLICLIIFNKFLTSALTNVTSSDLYFPMSALLQVNSRVLAATRFWFQSRSWHLSCGICQLHRYVPSIPPLPIGLTAASLLSGRSPEGSSTGSSREPSPNSSARRQSTTEEILIAKVSAHLTPWSCQWLQSLYIRSSEVRF